MDGEPRGEMFQETVVGEEDEGDQDEEIKHNPAAPDNNKEGLSPVNGNNPIIFFLGNVIKSRVILLNIDYVITIYWQDSGTRSILYCEH